MHPAVFCGVFLSPESHEQAFVFHALIDIGNVVAITVIDPGRHAFAVIQKTFIGLRPARMRDFRIYVGPEAIFIGVNVFPEAFGALVGEGKADDGFDIFKAVFPRCDQTQGAPFCLGSSSP